MNNYELGCRAGELSHLLKEKDLDSPWARKFLYDVSWLLKKYNIELSDKQMFFVQEYLEKYWYLLK